LYSAWNTAPRSSASFPNIPLDLQHNVKDH
jgi:hypothetical protein